MNSNKWTGLHLINRSDFFFFFGGCFFLAAWQSKQICCLRKTSEMGSNKYNGFNSAKVAHVGPNHKEGIGAESQACAERDWDQENSAQTQSGSLLAKCLYKFQLIPRAWDWTFSHCSALSGGRRAFLTVSYPEVWTSNLFLWHASRLLFFQYIIFKFLTGLYSVQIVCCHAVERDTVKKSHFSSRRYFTTVAVSTWDECNAQMRVWRCFCVLSVPLCVRWSWHCAVYT